MYRGGGYFQIPGKDVGPVRRQLASGPPKLLEGTPSMELSGESAKDGGGGAASVHNVLLGGVPGSITFWGRDLGLEAGGGTRGISKADNGAEGKASEGRDLAKKFNKEVS